MTTAKRKSILYAGAGILLVALVCLALYFKSVCDYKQAVRNMTLQEINLAEIADGTYIGECDVDFIYAKVEVTMLNGRMTNIAILEHKNGRGQPAEPVIGKIVEAQKIDVDTVAGATNSSIVLKKAVENALTQ